MGDFRKLSIEEAKKAGVLYSTKIADQTGEVRARVSLDGVAEVTLTRVSSEVAGGWQNSHSHARVVEITTVISGEVVQVEKIDDGSLQYAHFVAGDTFQTRPGHSHNVLVFPGMVLSTLKLNDSAEERDWIADLEMDARLSAITPEDALARC